MLDQQSFFFMEKTIDIFLESQSTLDPNLGKKTQKASGFGSSMT